MTDDRHHVQEGEEIRVNDPQQMIWCPNVQEWMTRADHQARFAPEGSEGLR